VARSAGAIAAGLLVWIALQRKPALASPKSAASPGGDEAGAPAPAPSTDTVGFDSGARDLSIGEGRPQESLIRKPDEFAGANTGGASGAVKSDGKQEYLAQVSPSKIDGRQREPLAKGCRAWLLR